MSCHNCAKSFSLFTKEKSCKNCGFAFCSSCLKRKMIIPKSGIEGNVCCDCEISIIKLQANRPPPDALQRRLDFLENPPAPNPITVYKASAQNKKMSNLKRGLSVEDKAIADRLEKLQRERKASMNIPTEAEMEERLRRLKDVSQVTKEIKGADHKNLLKNDNRSDEQKTKELFEQANAEVELESKNPKPEDEISQRLAKLRGQEINKTEKMDICPETFLGNTSEERGGKKPDELDDLSKLLDEVAMEAENDASVALKEFESDKDLQEKFKRIMQQKSQKDKEPEKSDSDEDEEDAKNVVIGILSEQKIDEQFMDEDIQLPEVPTFIPTQQKISRQLQRSMEEKEFPWCSICNEDAMIRCVEGCDGDLYCSRCFKECHDEVDLRDHKTVSYKPPKN